VDPTRRRVTRRATSSAEDAELIQSWDMAFKDTKGSDYVVGQVWLRRGVNAYLLDQVRGRWSFAETCDKLLALSAKWPQATAKLIEDKANGPAMMNALRARVPG
jgi:phage terminase large subunit-like protein